MDGQLRRPGLGQGAVGFRQGEQVHPLGRPGDGAVGIDVPGVEDDRRRSPLEGTGGHPDAQADQRPPFLQFRGVGTGQRVGSFRMEDAEMRRFRPGPAAEGVVPVLVELGRRKRCRRERDGQRENRKEDLAHNLFTKLIKFD